MLARSMLKQTTKNILAVAGVIAALTGVVVAIPSFLQNKVAVGTFAVALMVAGLVMLAIAFGD